MGGHDRHVSLIDGTAVAHS